MRVLGKCDEHVTPDRQRMDVLMQACLGKMNLVCPNKKATHNDVQSFLEEKFPRLQDVGGIEVMRAVGGGGGQRNLHIVPPGREGYSLAHIRECFSQPTVFIRPLQSDLNESPLSYEVNISFNKLFLSRDHNFYFLKFLLGLSCIMKKSKQRPGENLGSHSQKNFSY